MKPQAFVLTLVLCAAASFTSTRAAAQPSVDKVFLDASAKEQAVRTALAGATTTATVLKAVRTVVADYEGIVRRFPNSAYCDDALWRAGQLLLDAHARFGEGQDRTAAIRLLRAVASEYPSSKFAKQAPAVIAAAQKRQDGARDDARAVPPPPAAEPVRAPIPVKTTGTEAATPARVVTIKDIRRIVLADAVRIVIELDGEVPAFHDERLANPVRVFVDLTATRAAPELADRTIRFDSDADLVRQVRLGRHPNSTTRVVVDAAGVSSYSVYPLYSPYRLVIDCIKDVGAIAAIGPRSESAPIVAPMPAVVSKPPFAAAPPITARPPVELRTVAPSAPVAPLLGRRIVGQVATALPPVASPRSLRVVIPPPPVLRAKAIRVSRPVPLNPAAVRNGLMPPLLIATTLPAVLPLTSAAAVPTPTPSLPASAASRATAAAVGASAKATTPAAPLTATPTTTTAAATTTASAATTTAPATTTAAATTTAPVLPARPNIAGGFSMARQLGLGVSRIVIDPGHGGHDPGGVVRGTTEAAIVLDVALRLEKLLEKVEGVEVILTRRTDEFLGLQDRTAIANREGADLFLSIHANANTNSRASGVETYFLNFATNAAAAAIAARENAGSGQAMGALPDFVKMIALHNKMDESRDFATIVQRSLVEQLTPANKALKDLGVKQAPFVVLIGAAMPSALAEISFLTNAQEARLLRTSSYRQKIAEALLEAIRKYQTSLKTEVSVATQQ
jgi:N-acetylmuramoyl-L-alanine amidase